MIRATFGLKCEACDAVEQFSREIDPEQRGAWALPLGWRVVSGHVYCPDHQVRLTVSHRHYAARVVAINAGFHDPAAA